MTIKTTEYSNETDILIAPELAFAIPVIVTNASVTADSEGKKIIKAGTPLYASTDIFMNRQTKMTTVSTSNTDSTSNTAYGVARWDIDVTDGDTNATLLVAGYVDYLKLDSTVQTAVDTAKTSLTRILFLKGREA